MRGVTLEALPRPDAPPHEQPSYERHAGLHVVRLAGDDYEMGHQHGTLLREAVRRGPVPHFARYLEKLAASGVLGSAGVPLARAIGAALGHTVGRVIARQMPAHVRRALDGLADGARLDRGELLRAVTMPETYLWAVTRFQQLAGPAVAPRLSVPLYGCTSLAAWGAATTHGRVLHGRNFDYQGVGSWDREQVVAFHDPKDGQPYVSITAAGVLLGGITAMNAAGLTLVVHQHMACGELDLGGLPVGIVGDQVMRHARTLDDARRILDDHVPNGAWTYVVTSARESALLCYEVTSRRRASFVAEGDVFAYSNLFLDRRLDGIEHHFYPTYWRHNVSRYLRGRAMLEQARGSIDADAIASFLGDAGDPACRLRSSIAVLSTVASVVFDAGRGVVHVATGRAPVSSHPYVAFDLTTRAPLAGEPALHGGERRSTEPARRAFDAYREGYEAHFHDADVPRARAHLDTARAVEPGQPVYHFVAGLLALGADDPRRAEACLAAAIACGHPDAERLAGFHLWRGRARDLLGDRDGARRDYREARLGDANVRRAAERGLGAPFRGGRPAIEWNFGEVESP